MTAEIIEVTSCKRSLTAEIPAEEVEKEISGLARDYARNVKIPGFRPGKVPVSIVRQRFGADITGEATQKLIERYWKDAVESRDLKPLTQPEIQNMTHNPGENLTFTLEFEVLPEFEVKDYVGLEAKLDPSEVSDETVGRTIDMYRERQAQFIPLEGAEASEGHFLTVTVDGQFEGEAKPTRENDIILELGNPQTNPDFDNNLRGAKPGETRSFEVSYPEDYHSGALCRKKCHTGQVKDIRRSSSDSRRAGQTSVPRASKRCGARVRRDFGNAGKAGGRKEGQGGAFGYPPGASEARGAGVPGPGGIVLPSPPDGQQPGLPGD